MPNFDIVRTTKPQKSFRAQAILGTFDLQSDAIEERFVGEIKVPDDWQIGLIVGNSGTGKTTIAKQLFPDAYITEYDYISDCVLDDLGEKKSLNEITNVLNAVGFSSPPSWLKPYNVLSNGEKMRVDIAKALLEDAPLVVFDEYTSVVDRNVAKISAMATQKAIRKTKKRFIAVTCHHDVEEWLEPDWVFSTDEMKMKTGSKKNDRICNLTYLKQAGRIGKRLGSIII